MSVDCIDFLNSKSQNILAGLEIKPRILWRSSVSRDELNVVLFGDIVERWLDNC